MRPIKRERIVVRKGLLVFLVLAAAIALWAVRRSLSGWNIKVGEENRTTRAALAPESSSESGSAPLILITIDTLRADHLSLYGYGRKTSPAIDALGADSIVFKNAMSQAPHTIPSLLQLMTGEYLQVRAVSEDSKTLAELLSEAGYVTAAVVDNPIVEMRKSALDRGFDDFYMNDILDSRLEQQHWKTKMPADVVTRQAMRWLERRPKERPFFLWLHYIDPHDPYLPPFTKDLPFARQIRDSAWTGDIRTTFLYDRNRERKELHPRDRQHLIDLYDAEIAYLDQSLTDLMRFLRSEGLYRRALIVLTSDHGEGFGEHGFWTHGFSVYDEEVRVPLLIKLPAGAKRGGMSQVPAQLVDIVPTICQLLELEVPNAVDGRDLLEATGGYSRLLWYDWIVIRGPRWKLLSNRKTHEDKLFDLQSDPFETRNLVQKRPKIAHRLRQEMDRWLKSLRTSYQEAAGHSREQVEELRALGYLN